MRNTPITSGNSDTAAEVPDLVGPSVARGAIVPPSLVEIERLIQTDPIFLPFRKMLTNQSLLKFIYYEKCRFPVLEHENRIVVDPYGNNICGYPVNYYCPDDRYHPKVFMPFELKGVYLPLEEGELFTTLVEEDIASNPLITADVDGKKQILFLIHPKSEQHYTELLKKHPAISVQGLSLSSARSMLVAIPKSGDFVPALVKVSLDVELGGLNRLLSKRECAMSVGNSSVLQNKLLANPDLPLQIMQDPLAFVPTGYESGMLYRQLPAFMNPDNGQGRCYVAPFMSMFSVENLDIFRILIAQNAATVKDFLFKVLFEPFVTLIIKLHYKLHASIECHGQNLMGIYDHEDNFQGLLYRDMGGVNQIFSDSERESLPANLRSSEWYYESTHRKDSSESLERHFVQMLLFQLTKQLVKDPCFSEAESDPELQKWLAYVAEHMHNWSIDGYGARSNLHQEKILECKFYRYGYVEHQFAFCLLDRLKEEHIINDELHQDFTSQLYNDETLPANESLGIAERRVKPCSYMTFFDALITRTLPLNPLESACSPADDPACAAGILNHQ